MTDNFKYGDLVEAKDKVGGGSLTGWVTPDEDETGARLFVNFIDPDPAQGIFDFDGMVGDDNIEVTLVKTLAEQIPGTPGAYVDETATEFDRLLSEMTGEPFEPFVWTLNEDGSWTDPTGETASETWLFPVMGFTLTEYNKGE